MSKQYLVDCGYYGHVLFDIHGRFLQDGTYGILAVLIWSIGICIVIKNWFGILYTKHNAVIIASCITQQKHNIKAFPYRM